MGMTGQSQATTTLDARAMVNGRCDGQFENDPINHVYV